MGVEGTHLVIAVAQASCLRRARCLRYGRRKLRLVMHKALAEKTGESVNDNSQPEQTPPDQGLPHPPVRHRSPAEP